MAQPSPVAPVKLFVITLHRDELILNKAVSDLKARWGDIDFQSKDFPFNQTDYYEKEMGGGLQRRFYSFEKLIDPEQLVEGKLFTNQIEEKYAGAEGRRINLDPGYVDYYKLVLASMKFGGQKLYLRDGVYADMTLIVYKGKWQSFYWGFPDFKSGAYDEVLFQIRDLYKARIKSLS